MKSSEGYNRGSLPRKSTHDINKSTISNIQTKDPPTRKPKSRSKVQTAADKAPSPAPSHLIFKADGEYTSVDQEWMHFLTKLNLKQDKTFEYKYQVKLDKSGYVTLKTDIRYTGKYQIEGKFITLNCLQEKCLKNDNFIDFTSSYKGNVLNDKDIDMKSVKGIPDYKNRLKMVENKGFNSISAFQMAQTAKEMVELV